MKNKVWINLIKRSEETVYYKQETNESSEIMGGIRTEINNLLTSDDFSNKKYLVSLLSSDLYCSRR